MKVTIFNASLNPDGKQAHTLTEFLVGVTKRRVQSNVRKLALQALGSEPAMYGEADIASEFRLQHRDGIKTLLEARKPRHKHHLRLVASYL